MTTNSEIGQVLQKLIEGNKRFSSSRQSHPNQSREHRQELSKGQKPFAIIVGCSDSRVPPEIIFDQGLGDLFVIRVAGNIVDDVALGSIEYAVDHLGTSLLSSSVIQSAALSPPRCREALLTATSKVLWKQSNRQLMLQKTCPAISPITPLKQTPDLLQAR